MEKSIRIAQILGDKQEYYLGHSCKTIDKSLLYTPGPDVIEKVWMNSDRNLPTLNNMRRLLMQGRLANTGYVSILPVDQGVEHTAGASFAPNPLYFDPENIVKLAIEGGCNAVVSTFGVLGSVARKYAHKIPFVVKINHNELLVIPIHTTRFYSVRSKKPGIWEPSESVRLFISVHRKVADNWSKLRKYSVRRMN